MSFASIALSLTLCFDGGGTKTDMRILDEKGALIEIIRDGVDAEAFLGPCSNINSVGEEGVRTALGSLMKGVEIKGGNVPLTDVLARCRIVAGMAGVGLPQNREKVIALFKEWGLAKSGSTF